MQSYACLPCPQALHAAVQKLVDAAGSAGVQVLCLQEAWTMPFAFCTREREWLEFAEPAETGASTTMLQRYAQKYNMVIINSILERDEPHGETIWNTAVVIGHTGNVLGKHRKVCRMFKQWSMLLHTLSMVLMIHSARTLCRGVQHNPSTYRAVSPWRHACSTAIAICRTTYPGLEISMNPPITWKAIQAILYLTQCMARSQSTSAMGDTTP